MFTSMWVLIVFFTTMEACGRDDVFKSFDVMEGDVLNLHPGIDLKEKDQIAWSYECSRVAQIYRGKIYTHYDERFIGKVNINRKTGVLTISNIRINESGLYEAFIVIDRKTSKRKYNIDVYALTSLVTEHQSTGTSQASNTSTHHPQEIYPPNEDGQDHCGMNEVLIRLVLSGLVSIAMVAFLVEHLRFCSAQ